MAKKVTPVPKVQFLMWNNGDATFYVECAECGWRGWARITPSDAMEDYWRHPVHKRKKRVK